MPSFHSPIFVSHFSQVWMANGEPFAIVTGRAVQSDGQDDEVTIPVEDYYESQIASIQDYPENSTPSLKGGSSLGPIIGPNQPTVVLMNGGSASTSELLAGALSDGEGASIQLNYITSNECMRLNRMESIKQIESDQIRLD
jgi:hypothetical protein